MSGRPLDYWLNPNNPVPSEEFTTAYNQRLPEWRLQEYKSANQEHWRNRRECQLAMFGVTLGFNNMIYLPSMALKEDTYGAFAIQLIILEFLIGFPLLFLQLAVGQFTSFGPFQLMKMVPLAEGVGVAFLISNIYTILRQSVFMSWTVFYMLSSFYITTQPTFAWTTAWDNCPRDEVLIRENVACAVIPNVTTLINADLHCYYTYFLKNVLELPSECNVSNVSSNIGQLNGKLVGCLLLIWILGFLFLYRGLQSIGKAVFWVVPITVLLFCVFIIVGITKYHGASEGIKYYLSINWVHFYDLNVWYAALEHVINSLGLKNGTMIVIGGYARFQSPAHYDAFYLCLLDVFFSFLAALVIFSFIGISALHFGVTIDDMFVDQQVHYAMFIIFPCALDITMPFPPIWVFICFGTVLMMAVTSMHTNFLVFLKPLYDLHPWHRQNRPLSSMMIIIIFFLAGVTWLVITNNGARYIQMRLASWEFIGHWIIVTCFVAAFVYGYGLKRLRENIDFMLHFRPNKFFCIIWCIIPILLILAMLCSIILTESEEITEVHMTSHIILLITFAINVIPIPAMALWNIYRFYRKGTLNRLIRPREDGTWQAELTRAGVPDDDTNLTRQRRRMITINEVGENNPHTAGRWAHLREIFSNNTLPGRV